MPPIDKIEVELTVRIGEADLTLRQLLSKGRGAVVPLDTDVDTPLTILANGSAIAQGKVVLHGENIAIEIIDMRPEERAAAAA